MYRISERTIQQMSAEFIEGGYRIVIADHAPDYRSVYLVRLSWMGGDSDIYTYTNLIVEPKDLVRSIKALTEAQGKRLGGWRDEGTITSDIAWLFGGGLSQEEYDKIKQNDKHEDYWEVKDTSSYEDYLYNIELDSWERDRSCDDCGNARLDGWKLTYYDNAGLPHNVQVFEQETKITSDYWRE